MPSLVAADHLEVASLLAPFQNDNEAKSVQALERLLREKSGEENIMKIH